MQRDSSNRRPDDGVDEASLEMERLSDDLVQDFDDACAVFTSTLLSDADLGAQLTILMDVVRGGDELLPNDVMERVESEFLPQVVQLLLSRAVVENACGGVTRVNSFFQFVLERVALRLLQCDPCLLPSLVRIFDEHRPFYLYHPDDQDEVITDASEYTATKIQQNESITTSQFVASTRVGLASILFLRNIVCWGELGGFTLFLRCLQAGSDAVQQEENSAEGEEVETSSDVDFAFEAMQCIFRALYSVKDHLSSQFLVRYFPMLIDSTRIYISRLPPSELHGVPREALLEVIQVMEVFLPHLPADVRTHVDEYPEVLDDEAQTSETYQTKALGEAHLHVRLLRLDMMFRFFTSPSLEKRIYGLSEIATILKVEGNVSSRNAVSDSMVGWISDHQLIETIFGDTKHPELIKRSTPVFMFAHRTTSGCGIPKEWMLALWSCFVGKKSSEQATLTQSHESVRAAAHHVLSELVESLDHGGLDTVFELIRSLRSLDLHVLSLLSCMATRSLAAMGLRDRILMHMWLTLPTLCQPEVIDSTIQRIEEILRVSESQNGEQRDGGQSLVLEFLGLCLSNLESRQCVELSLRLLERIGAIAHESCDTVIADFSVAERLIKCIITEFEEYKAQTWKSAWRHRSPTPLVSRASWLSLTEDQRRDCGLIFPDDHLNAIRHRLLALRAAWLLNVMSGNTPAMRFEDLERVWQESIQHAFQSDEVSLCFQWFEYCFNTEAHGQDRLLSLEAANLLVLSKFRSLSDQQITLSTLCCFHSIFRRLNVHNGGLVSHNDRSTSTSTKTSHEDDSEDSVADLMTGEPLIGIEELWHLSLHASDAVVAEEAITLLARCHLDFVPDLRLSDKAKSRQVEFIDVCMQHLVPAKATLFDSGSSGALAIVRRCLDCLRYFLEACKVAEEQDIVPLPPAPSDTSQRLKLENLEEKLRQLETYPSPMKEGTSADLAMMTGPRRPSWTFRQHHALLEAIRDEAEDEESAMSELNRRIMDVAANQIELTDLTVEIPFISERRLSTEITIQENVRPTQLTKSPTVRTRPSLDWSALGVQPLCGPGLHQDEISCALQGSPRQYSAAEMLSSEVKSVAEVLVSRSEYFKLLFDLVDEEESISERSWELLCQLPTSMHLLRQMVRLRPQMSDMTDAVVVWEDLIDPTRVYRTQYALRLIEALLLPLECGAPEQEDAARRQWRERFVRLGGTHHLYQTGHTLLLTVREASSHSLVRQIVLTCLASIMRVLVYFVKLYKLASSSAKSIASPYDKRLLQISLPVFLNESVGLEKLLDLALQVSCGQGNLLRQQDECRRCALELFCALTSLDASAAVRSFNLVDGGMRAWQLSLFSSAASCELRTSALKTLGYLGATTHTTDDEGFLLQFLDTATLLLLELDINKLTGELYDVVCSFLLHLSSCSRFAISTWAQNVSLVPSLLERIEKTLTITCEEKHLLGFLRILQALVSVDEVLKSAVLVYEPKWGVSNPKSSWIVDVLISQLLWGEESARRSLPRSQIESARTEDLTHAAQELLIELVVRSSHLSDRNLAAILQTLHSFTQRVEERLNDSGRPWNFHPQDELQDRTKGIGFAGLVNPGCVCYMNSLLQQLFMIPAFRDGMLSLECGNSPAASAPWREEFMQLQKLFVSLAETELKAVDPTEFALSHRDLDGQPTDLHVQMDADEFFCLLLDRVETFIRALEPAPSSLLTRATTFVDGCFGGVLVNQILTEQGHMSEREEKFFALSVEVAKKDHLTESLALYVQGETLDGENAYYCDHAQRKVSAIKRVCIKTLPRTLVCHLKRFEFDFDTMEKVKINDYLEFPTELDMYPYTSDAFAAVSGEATDNNESHTRMYDLVGVVVHSGTADMGHYYSFIRDRNTEGAWFEFNDQSVRNFNPTTMDEECFGGEEVTQRWDVHTRAMVPVVQMKRRSAYMLIYERRTDAARISSLQSGALKTISQFPQSVGPLVDAVRKENAAFRQLLRAFDADHSTFLLRLAEKSICRGSCETNKVVQEALDVETMRVCQVTDILLRTGCPSSLAAMIVCQHVMGILSLRQTDTTGPTEDSPMLSVSTSLLACITGWVRDSAESELFCVWLLKQLTAAPHADPVATNSASTRRSWLFDIVFLMDKTPSYVQACFALIHVSLNRLQHPASAIRGVRRPLGDFFRVTVQMFYDREDVELVDVSSGALFPTTHSMIINGVTFLGSFLKDCVIAEKHVQGKSPYSDGSRVESASVIQIQDILLNEVRFLDRFLFSLRSEAAATGKVDDGSAFSNHAGGVSSQTSRVRSCTFIIERQILMALSTHLPESACPVDTNLISNQAQLKNLFIYQFDQVMTPVLVSYVTTAPRIQRDKLVTQLIAVLEDVKMSFLDQMLTVFRALLSADAAVPSLRIHEQLFSPSSGILEAAAYYRDHKTLHEYAFLLVEFVILQAGDSCTLQRYLQAEDEIIRQVAWIKDWLGNYLDPHETVRSANTHSHNSGDDGTRDQGNDDDEDVMLTKEVRRLFTLAERAFGFDFFPKQVDRNMAPEEDLAEFSVESLEDSDATSADENQADEEEQDDVDEVYQQEHGRFNTKERVPECNDVGDRQSRSVVHTSLAA